MHPCDVPGKAKAGCEVSLASHHPYGSVRFDMDVFYLRASFRVNPAVLLAVAEGLNGLSH